MGKHRVRAGATYGRNGSFFHTPDLIRCFPPCFLLLLGLFSTPDAALPVAQLQTGALVYARVSMALRDMDPQLTCMAPPGVAAKDWMTRESIFGELGYGGGCSTLIQCPTSVCAMLEVEDCPLLDALGEVAPFEIAGEVSRTLPQFAHLTDKFPHMIDKAAFTSGGATRHHAVHLQCL